MDKVKIALNLLKKYHFWVLCLVVVIFGAVAWSMGTGALASAHKQNLSTLETKFKSMDSPKVFVGPGVKEVVDGEHEKLKTLTFEEWKKNFAAQQALFRWPKEVADIGKLDWRNKDIRDDLRRLYFQVYAKHAVEDLGNVFNARRMVVIDAKGRERKATPEEIASPTAIVPPERFDWVGIVTWDQAHRQLLEARLAVRDTPSSEWVRVTQEDLWVLEQMGQAIAAANQTATDPFNAPVKRIISMDVGQWAIEGARADVPSVILEAADGAAATTSGGPDIMGGGTGGLGGMGGAEGAGGEAISAEERQKQADADLRTGRYLGEDGEPILTVEGVGPYAEFNQLFVRYQLVVDQARIPEILVACMNNKLPIDIRRVRVTGPHEGPLAPDFADAGGGGGGAMGMPGGGMRGGEGGGMPGMGMGGGGRFGGGGMGAMGPMRPGGAMGGAAPAAAAPGDGGVEPRASDVTLEICGVVYLFKPPVLEQLGTGTATDPAKRARGVPTTAVKLPGNITTMGGMAGPGMMPGPRGGGGRFE